MGATVGTAEGDAVGTAVGDTVGRAVGGVLGVAVGTTVGSNVGVAVGDDVGAGVGHVLHATGHVCCTKRSPHPGVDTNKAHAPSSGVLPSGLHRCVG